MKMVFMKKDEGWLYSVRGKVKEFVSMYEGVKYFKRNKLEEKGFIMYVEGIDKEKNKECLKYL
jgi:hypothetical protein